MIYTDALQTVIMVGGALVLMFLGKEENRTHPSFAPKSCSHLPLVVSSMVWWALPRAQSHTPLQARGPSLWAKPGEPASLLHFHVPHQEPRDSSQNWELAGPGWGEAGRWPMTGSQGSEGGLTHCGLSPQASRR